MKFIRTLFFYLLLLITFFLGTAWAILFSLFSSPSNRIKNFQKVAKQWGNLLVWISGIPLSVRGIENLPKNESVIYASNHQGAADILILLAVLPENFTFIIKKELFDIPLFGWYLRAAGYISIDRGSRRGAVEMINNSIKRLKEGGSILVFPEGTRSPDGKLQEFKRGSLLLAYKAGVRVVPIAIDGSYYILPKKSRLINPVPVKVSIGEPFSLDKFEGDYNKANDELYKIIEKMLG
ncbi:MAG: lysophospholipid acyltransferase family protein [Candidatus Margulisiibacteriota bacterium]